MNDNKWQHPLAALTASVLVTLLGLPLWLCFIIPLICIGREHAQAEYRWIETFGSHRRASLPWWGGFDKRVWDIHSWWWNLLLPCIISISVVCANYAISHP